jgi:hypothetical protein
MFHNAKGIQSCSAVTVISIVEVVQGKQRFFASL